eukprot:6191124-Pleurochrysis_carterae.AAC.2
MHWSELLPTELLAKLLLERFFPKWLLTLQHWLSQQPDFGEVSRWYVGWKGEVGERAPALLSHDGVRDQLNVALDLLNTALGDEARDGTLASTTRFTCTRLLVYSRQRARVHACTLRGPIARARAPPWPFTCACAAESRTCRFRSSFSCDPLSCAWR